MAELTPALLAGCFFQGAPNIEEEIVRRATWGAREPLGRMREHRPRFVTVHHSATRQHRDTPIEQKMRQLQVFAQQAVKLANGRLKPQWPDVPYHFYIDVAGQVAEGRDILAVGNTNTEYDPTGHILVVLEGNFEEEQPSGPQLASLTRLASWLAARWEVPPAQIKGHSDYARTLCPGRNLIARLDQVRRTVARERGGRAIERPR